MAKIPRLRINTSQIMLAADSRVDLMTYDSDVHTAGYVTDGDEILIITSSRGYLRLKNSDMQIMLEELKWIVENNEMFRR